MLDLEALTKPVAGDSAVGPELRGEVDFGELEESPRQFTSKTPAELKKVIVQCGAMFARTKDQMPALVALEAAARLGDFAAMRAAVGLLEHLLADHWEAYHPGPAEEMGEARVNEVAALKRPAALLLPLARMALTRLPGPASIEFTAGMIATASKPVAAWDNNDEAELKKRTEAGQITLPDAAAQRLMRERGRLLRQIVRSISPDARAADIEAGVKFDETVEIPDVEAVARGVAAEIGAAREPLADLADALYAVEEAFQGKLGQGPGLGVVVQALRNMATVCENFLVAFAEPAPPPEVEAGEIVADGAGAAAAAARGGGPLSIESVRTRTDVLTALDSIIRYYADNEPASPVPLMLTRVRAWVGKDFLELMRDLHPGSNDDLKRLLAPPS